MSRQLVGIPSAVMNTPQERLLQIVPYTNGGTTRVYSPDIPKSLYPYWVLKLKGTLAKTQACAGTLVPEGPFTLISGMRVTLDGEILKEIDLTHLRVLSHLVYKGIDTDYTNVTLGTNAGEAFEARCLLDFRTLRSSDPEKTLLPAHRYGQLGFEVDWTAQTATSVPGLVSGGVYSAVSFTVAPTLEVWGKEELHPGKMNAGYMLQRYSQKIFPFSSTAQTAAAFQVPTGEVFRGILLSQYTNSPRTPISTLVAATANIVLRANGNTRKIETNWKELQQHNKSNYGVAMPTGYAMIDFMDPETGGQFVQSFRTDPGSGINSLELLVDTASVANAILQLTMITFKPARPAR